MNKTTTHFMLVFALILNACRLWAQNQPDSVQFYLSVKDSSKTIFSHDVIRMWQSDFPTVDGVDIIPDWDRKGSGIEIKFPHREWTQYDYFTAKYHYIEPFLDGLMIEYLNLMPMFVKDTSLFNDVKNGAKIYLRFRYNLRWKNQNTFSVSYSQVDSLWLPPANEHDIEGLRYIRQHLNEIKIGHKLGQISGNLTDTLANLFPLSLIGELAAHHENDLKIDEFTLKKIITVKQRAIMIKEEALRFIQHGRSDIIADQYKRAYGFK
jgi:hypothetical protein